MHPLPLKLPDHPLIEGLITTVDSQGRPHITPMGPIVSNQWDRLLLRPYAPSTTLTNLQSNHRGVFHITDDTELFARAVCHDDLRDVALDLESYPPLPILAEACRWYAFEVTEVDSSRQPAHVQATIVAEGRFRDFVGFHRARHAVIEAAILATRTHLIPMDHIHAELGRLLPLVEKTGSNTEHGAFERIKQAILNMENDP